VFKEKLKLNKKTEDLTIPAKARVGLLGLKQQHCGCD